MVLVAIMSLSVLLQVFFRYFLDSPLVWSEELARFCMIWITFFGATVALRNKSLVAVDIVVEKLSGKYRKIITIANYTFMIFMCGFLFYMSSKLMFSLSVAIQKSAAIRLPMRYVYICLPVSYALMLVHLIIQFIESFQKKEVTPK